MNIGVLIIVAAVGLGKWLLQRAEKPAEDDGGEEAGTMRSQPPPPAARESNEEQTRRFMEALGLPADSAPPPPAVGRTQEQAGKRSSRETNVPPLYSARERPEIPPRRSQWERRQLVPPPERMPRQEPARKTALTRDAGVQRERVPMEEVMSASVESGFPLVPMQAPEVQAVQQRVPWRVELRERGALRKAFILREIIGPAKALQSERQTGIFTPL